MANSAALASRPPAAIVAQAAGPKLPSLVTREQARAIINAAETTTHRLLLETLWQTGGRVQEVLRLRLRELCRQARIASYFAPGASVLHSGPARGIATLAAQRGALKELCRPGYVSARDFRRPSDLEPVGGRALAAAGLSAGTVRGTRVLPWPRWSINVGGRRAVESASIGNEVWPCPEHWA